MRNIGPLMLDIQSTVLSASDKTLLANKLVGGIILFSRNFESADQILKLTNEIKTINPSILIAVDQEGGRVQRFTQGFSKLPALNTLGALYQKDKQAAISYSYDLGELMALEVQSVGCDISFAPVLDLGYSTSRVIGDRAFSTKIEEIVVLGKAYVNGMRDAGMGATGKHFPGHGSVEADSHFDIPYDNRNLAQIKDKDLSAFSQLSVDLAAVMPAHIVYQQIDENPAGFSKIWLKKILREELGFNGVIFSDDLSMKGAEVVGDFKSRAELALEAGCDMILVCNDRPAALKVVEHLNNFQISLDSQNRIAKLLMKNAACGLDALKETSRWQRLNSSLQEFEHQIKNGC